VNRPLDILDQALAEAEDAARWYADRSPTAAAAFVEELERAVAAIERAPETWPPYDHGTRRFLLQRFPYSVVYQVTRTQLIVVAIVHAHRRPGYWKGR
jgi:plasmid stabilization system protein ParE